MQWIFLRSACASIEKQDDPRPIAMDVAAQNFPMGQAATPTTMEQNYGMQNRAQSIPLLKEIFIDTKGIFVKDPSTQFANATGGQQFVFLREKGLEDAVQRISQEVHSQYLVSYTPSNGGRRISHDSWSTSTGSPAISARRDLATGPAAELSKPPCNFPPAAWAMAKAARVSETTIRIKDSKPGRKSRLPNGFAICGRISGFWSSPGAVCCCLGFVLICISRVCGFALPISSQVSVR